MIGFIISALDLEISTFENFRFRDFRIFLNKFIKGKFPLINLLRKIRKSENLKFSKVDISRSSKYFKNPLHKNTEFGKLKKVVKKCFEKNISILQKIGSRNEHIWYFS